MRCPPRRARCARRAPGHPERRGQLGARPADLSALPYSQNRLGLTPEQHAWFLQLAALHRAGALAGLPGESDWIHLDDFQSPLLWPLLRQAEGLGIAFVTGKQAGGVTLGSEARVLLDTARSEGGLVIGASAVIDGRPVATGAARTIGDHGVYAFRESPSFAVTLAPTPEPVPEDQRRMLVEGARITVPEPEVDEFLADWSPRLRVRADSSARTARSSSPNAAPRSSCSRPPSNRHGHPGPTTACTPVALARRRPEGPGRAARAPPRPHRGPHGRRRSRRSRRWPRLVRRRVIDDVDVAVFANELLPQLTAHGIRAVVQGERLDYERLSGRPTSVSRRCRRRSTTGSTSGSS